MICKDNKRKRHINEYMRTSLNSGRIAGTGMLYDDYSETSYPSGMMRTDYFPEKKVGIPLTEAKNRLLQSHFSLDHVKQFLRANDLSQVQEIYLIHLSAGNSDAERFKREVMATTGKPVIVANK